MEHMDPAARKHIENTRSAQPCEFCREHDRDFLARRLIDQMVAPKKAAAAAHLTEDGYVRHRILELCRISSRITAA